MQARRQQDDFGRENGQFAIGPVLGVTAAGEPDDTDDISSPEMLMLRLEGHVALHVLRLGDHLDLDALGPDIVEDQLGT